MAAALRSAPCARQIAREPLRADDQRGIGLAVVGSRAGLRVGEGCRC